MKGILLAGRDRDLQNLAPGHIDQQISSLRALGIEPAIVLGGNSAEDILRGNRTVESCEIAFDTHTETTDFTNLLAAVHLASGEFLAVLPELPPLDHKSLAAFRHQLAVLYQEPFHFVRIFEMGPWPLLVTTRGQKIIANTDDLSGWNDPRLHHCSTPLTRQVNMAGADAV